LKRFVPVAADISHQTFLTSTQWRFVPFALLLWRPRLA